VARAGAAESLAPTGGALLEIGLDPGKFDAQFVVLDERHAACSQGRSQRGVAVGEPDGCPGPDREPCRPRGEEAAALDRAKVQAAVRGLGVETKADGIGQLRRNVDQAIKGAVARKRKLRKKPAGPGEGRVCSIACQACRFKRGQDAPDGLGFVKQ